CQVQGTPAVASGLRLGITPAPRPRSGSHRHQIQRDHRHPVAAPAPRTERRAGHPPPPQGQAICAMGCQTRIAATILDRGADYLLAVKDNQPALNDDIERYFADAPAEELQTFQTTEAD